MQLTMQRVRRNLLICSLMPLLGIVGCQRQLPVPELAVASIPSRTHSLSVSSPAPSAKLSQNKFVGLSVVHTAEGRQSTAACAWRNYGSLWCWGQADALPPSVGHTRVRHRTHDGPDYVNCVMQPARVDIPRRVKSASIGSQHGCASDDNGGLWCWGQWKIGSSGQIECVPLPEAVEWVVVKAAICAKGRSGAVYCWPTVLGWLNPPLKEIPTRVPFLDDARQVLFANDDFISLSAVRKDGGPWFSGSAVVPPGLGRIEQAWADSGVCVRNELSQVWCWGIVGAGKEAERVPELDGATHIAFSGTSYCEVVSDGRVRCGDFPGQRGAGATWVRGLSQIKTLFVSQDSLGGRLGLSPDGLEWYGTGCALATTGHVLCFGRDDACDDDVSFEVDFRKAPQLVVPGEQVIGEDADRKERDRRYELLRRHPTN